MRETYTPRPQPRRYTAAASIGRSLQYVAEAALIAAFLGAILVTIVAAVVVMGGPTGGA